MRTIFILLVITLGARIPISAQQLTLATYQYSDNPRLQNISPLAEHLQKLLNIKVIARSYPTVHEFITGIQYNEADIALINTFGYLLLQASQKTMTMQPMLALQVRSGTKDNYTTAIVAPASSAINNIKDISKYAAETKLMLVSPGSTSGNLVPRLALSSVGIPETEKRFSSVVYGKTHSATVESVANGTVSLAAMGSAEYFSYISKPENKDKVKLVWLSPEIPLGPVLIKKSLDKNLQQKIINILLELHIQNEEALHKVKAGWSEAKYAERYILITDIYYNPFRKQLGKKKDLKRILEQFAN